MIKHRDLAAILKIHFNGAGIATSEIDGIDPMLARTVKIVSFQRSVAGDLHPAGGATAGWKTWHAKCSPGEIDLHVAQSRIGLIYELDGQPGDLLDADVLPALHGATKEIDALLGSED